MKHPDSDTIAAALARIELVEAWCKAVRDRAFALLNDGYEVPGYKLVRGKRGPRQWDNDDAAARVLGDVLESAAYKPREVISPAQAEKLLKKKGLTLEDVGLTIAQSEGAVQVAPSGDPRPAIDAGAEADEFDNLAGEKGNPNE